MRKAKLLNNIKITYNLILFLNLFVIFINLSRQYDNSSIFGVYMASQITVIITLVLLLIQSLWLFSKFFSFISKIKRIQMKSVDSFRVIINSIYLKETFSIIFVTFLIVFLFELTLFEPNNLFSTFSYAAISIDKLVIFCVTALFGLLITFIISIILFNKITKKFGLKVEENILYLDIMEIQEILKKDCLCEVEIFKINFLQKIRLFFIEKISKNKKIKNIVKWKKYQLLKNNKKGTTPPDSLFF